MPDRSHIFIEANPFDSGTNIIKIFKGVTGLRMFNSRRLLHQLCRGVLWSASFYVDTNGHVYTEVIEKYIFSNNKLKRKAIW
jgi:REP element-mobilizing transposase RayT